MTVDLSSTEVSRTRMSELLSKVRGLAAEVREQQHALWDVNQALSEVVTAHERERFVLLRSEWEAQGMGWCTRGAHVVPQEDLALLFCEGSRWTGSEYTEAIEDYRELHTSCPACRQEALRRSGFGHGKRGEEFWAFETEEAEGSVRICRFGKWEPLPQYTRVVECTYITAELAQEWELPPKIRFAPFCGTLQVGVEEVSLR